MYSIGAAARLSGLTPHVLRAWEKRYGILSTVRTGSNRRMYSDEDIDKLILLKRAVDAGYSLKTISGLSAAELAGLGRSGTASGKRSSIASDAVSELLNAARVLDAREFERILLRTSLETSLAGLLESVLTPFLETVGRLWHHGDLRIAQEHLSSSVIRAFLAGRINSSQTPVDSPVLVAATLSGQLHEMGALMAAATAVDMGWKAVYLGADLPADEIASAVRLSRAGALLLSIIYRANENMLRTDLETVASLLPRGCALIVGGRAAALHQQYLNELGAHTASDLQVLRELLQSLRNNSLNT